STHFTSPLKLFEYMAAGRAIVASDLPAIREVLRHEVNALLVTPGDSTALAGGIERLLADSELAARLARNALNDVDDYTWSRRAEGLPAVRPTLRCTSCGTEYPQASESYLDLRPREQFAEQTKYLDASLHADAR